MVGKALNKSCAMASCRCTLLKLVFVSLFESIVYSLAKRCTRLCMLASKRALKMKSSLIRWVVQDLDRLL